MFCVVFLFSIVLLLVLLCCFSRSLSRSLSRSHSSSLSCSLSRSLSRSLLVLFPVLSCSFCRSLSCSVSFSLLGFLFSFLFFLVFASLVFSRFLPCSLWLFLFPAPFRSVSVSFLVSPVFIACDLLPDGVGDVGWFVGFLAAPFYHFYALLL